MRSCYIVSALAPAMLCVTASLGAQRPEATLQRAIAAYANAETIAVRFDQTVTNPLTDRTLTSSGELMRRRPNRLSISFGGTNPDRIVADGTNLWVYLPSSAPGQVIKLPAAGESGMLVDPMGQILSAPVSNYDVTDAGASVVSGEATHAITLVPKSRAALFTKATLWIDDTDGLVRQLESTEPSGLVRKITVTRFRTNVTIPRSTFQFTPPANVRVIDGGGMIGG
ncbi:MAG TPA: outer membrane lipoprotein carrier protein LolA [Gemmatimonadaceae bacterium]|nr:outer membrane lipoprotein carrier protein LolA [Gemmatimonadaceae bacterium]